MQASMQADQFCLSSCPDDREGPASAGREDTFIGPGTNDLLHTDESRFPMESDSYRSAVLKGTTNMNYRWNNVETPRYRGRGMVF